MKALVRVPLLVSLVALATISDKMAAQNPAESASRSSASAAAEVSTESSTEASTAASPESSTAASSESSTAGSAKALADVTSSGGADAAARGYSLLVNGGYVGCGIPLDLLKRSAQRGTLLPPRLLALVMPLAGDTVFKPAGIPGRNADNQNIAPHYNVFDTPRGIKAVNSNCLSCHGENLNGTFVVGLGNRTRDFTQDSRSLAEALPGLARTEAERQEAGLVARGMAAVAPYIQTRTVGVNPAVNLTYALFSHRRVEDFRWSEMPTLEPPDREFPPVDVPPWWHLKEKKAMFHNGEFTTQMHRVMALASTLCVEDADSMRQLDEPFRDVEQFIMTVPGPRYPLAIDPVLARQGQEVFEDNCARCHGELDDKGRVQYEPSIVPIDTLGTDPELMRQQTGPEHERFRRWGEESFVQLYGQRLQVTLNQGYIVPPLTGVWATAPYLHNGSVPSVEAVLNSKMRPRYWQKLGIFEKTDYDTARMSVRFRARMSGQALAEPLTRRFIYDTTLKGYGNQGHTYGDRLTQPERLAVMEFLKTL